MPSETTHKPALGIVDKEVPSDATRSRDANDSAPVAVCQQCFGTGVEIVPGKGARPCDCRAQDSRRTFLNAARIPKRYANCKLDNFDVEGNESKAEALQYARCLVRDYPYIDRGLLLMGSVGVGKTHLAVAILHGLMQRGVPCLFYEFGSLLKKIQDSYNPISKTSELTVLAAVYETEVLVLDELGARIPTEWVRETMYQIINTRYNDQRLTIFTTNFLDEALIEQTRAQKQSSEAAKVEWSDGEAKVDKKSDKLGPKSLEERIGFPLRSRLYQMCNTVLIKGGDYRKRWDKREL